MIATRHSNTVVNPCDKLAGMRIIPLVIEEKMDKVRSLITSIDSYQAVCIKKSSCDHRQLEHNKY